MDLKAQRMVWTSSRHSNFLMNTNRRATLIRLSTTAWWTPALTLGTFREPTNYWMKWRTTTIFNSTRSPTTLWSKAVGGKSDCQTQYRFSRRWSQWESFLTELVSILFWTLVLSAIRWILHGNITMKWQENVFLIPYLHFLDNIVPDNFTYSILVNGIKTNHSNREELLKAIQLLE